MSDFETVVLAVAVAFGCSLAAPVPLWAGAVGAFVALAIRSPRLFILAGLALGLSAGHRAENAYAPMEATSFDGPATLLSLPEVQTFTERALVRLPTGERIRLSVAPSAGSMRTALPGSTLRFSGRIQPAEPNVWNRTQHVVGSASATSVSRVDDGALPWRVAASLQRLVDRSTSSMDDRSAALYDGLVTGDDRSQGAAQRAIFRRVGLSHILAVSGQNVAFVLVISHLLVGRLSWWGRPPMVGLILVLFALVTQLEPSVLRATVTAGLAYCAVAAGRAGNGVRILALAVSTLLLIDPFLVGALSFQLSVLASAGILLLAPAFAKRLPGPPWLRIPMAVTLAAQVTVAPLLIAVFGSVSAVSLPANLLAGWAAGAVMMWGMSIGLIAGLVGGSLGATLQLPVVPLLWWIDAVARFSARVPLAPVGIETALIGAVIVVAGSVLPRLFRMVGFAAIVALAFVGAGAARPPALQLLDGGVLLRDGSITVLILEPGVTDRIVQEVLDAQPGPIGIVIVRGGNRSVSGVLKEINVIAEVGQVFAPPHHTVVGATRLVEELIIETRLGPIRVGVESKRKLNVAWPGS